MLLKRFTLLLFVLFAAVAQARLRPAPGEFGFEEEWVYFNPLFDTPFGLLAGSQVTTAQARINTFSLLANQFDYQSGFRVGGAYGFCECCLDLHVRYTRLSLDSSRKVKGYANMDTPLSTTNPKVILTINTAANMESRFGYHDVDATVRKVLLEECGCLDFLFLSGLRFSKVDLTQEVVYGGILFNEQMDVETPEKRGCFWGIGPEVGFDFAYEIGCGLSFTGRAEGGLLVSHMDAKFDSTEIGLEPDGSLLFNNVISLRLDETWRVVPLYDVRLGVAFRQCCPCLAVSIEGGYEALSYIRALPLFRDQTEGGFGLSGNGNTYSSVDLHGPYINVAITF